MSHNQKITFEGDADEAPGTVAGDVVVVLQQLEHATFKRDGNHLFYKAKVTLLEALTGGRCCCDVHSCSPALCACKSHLISICNSASTVLKIKIIISRSICNSVSTVELAIEHMDGRTLIVKGKPGECLQPGDFKMIRDEGMPSAAK
jgi:DnaJ family protein A protein 2